MTIEQQIIDPLYQKGEPETRRAGATELLAAVDNLAEEMLNLLLKLDEHCDTDKRWVAIGKTHFQEGLMSLRRSLFKPRSL